MKSTSEIVWFKPPKRTQAELVRLLKRKLRGRVRHAYLFGSYARGTANDESDIDLILVTPTGKSWERRWMDFKDLYRQLCPMDLLVYTPEEWVKMNERGSSLIENARGDWKKII